MVGWAHLLFGLVARAGPLGDDVFLGLGVGCEGKCDAGEGSTLDDLQSASAPHVAAWGSMEQHSQSRCQQSAVPWSGPRPRPLPCSVCCRTPLEHEGQLAGEQAARRNLRRSRPGEVEEDSLAGHPGADNPSAAVDSREHLY